MARLPDPDPAEIPDKVREFLAPIPPDPVVKMLTHSTATVIPFISLAQVQFTALELPARARELAILTVAVTTGCDFVFAQHGPISAAAGVDDATRDIIRSRDFASPELSPYDRVVIGFAADVVAGPRVPEAQFEEATRFLSAREIVELLQVCGFYWSFGRVCTVLDVELTQIYGPNDPLGR